MTFYATRHPNYLFKVYTPFEGEHVAYWKEVTAMHTSASQACSLFWDREVSVLTSGAFEDICSLLQLVPIQEGTDPKYL